MNYWQSVERTCGPKFFNMIKFIKGDATSPIGDGNKIIIHCCNDIGAWGSGFVVAISKRWSEPENEYRDWYKTKKYTSKLSINLGGNSFLIDRKSTSFGLGKVLISQVHDDMFVGNIIGQSGTISNNNQSPIVYDAIRGGVRKINGFANIAKASVHMPRMGCGLAGGKWSEIERIITEELPNIDVTVYDF